MVETAHPSSPQNTQKMAQNLSSKKQKPEQTSPFSRIPTDLIPSILSKLPIKSLCKFKSVSKPWLSTIQNPHFVEKIRSKAPFKWVPEPDIQLTVFTIDDNGSVTEADSFYLHGMMWHCRYCNGLICFRDDCVRIFNPATREHLLLPPVSCHDLDLGFDPVSRKYKILAWKVENMVVPVDFKIFTLESEGSWKPLQTSPDAKYLGDSVCATGIMFWIHHSVHKLIAFNLGEEEFGAVTLPGVRNEEQIYDTIFVFDGCVCYVELPKPVALQGDERRCHLEIVNMWMLKDVVNNVWVSMMNNVRFDMEGTGLKELYYGYDEDIRHFDGKEVSFASARSGEIMMAASDENNQYVYVYNLLSGNFMFKRFKIHHWEMDCWNILRVFEATSLCLEEFGDLYYRS